MNRLFLLIMLVSLVSVGVALASQDAGTGAGTPDSVTVADILESPGNYPDTNLSVEGKITSQCGSGCWFILSDETGALYVDLKPNNFVIPPSMGKKIVVNGTILEKNRDIIFIGRNVTVEGTPYP